MDFLLVDEPRGKRSIARHPALIALEPRMATDSTVVLDDYHRPGEKKIVSRWSSLTDFEFADYGRCNLTVGRRL